MLIHSRGCFSSYPSRVFYCEEEGLEIFFCGNQNRIFLLARRISECCTWNFSGAEKPRWLGEMFAIKLRDNFFLLLAWWHVYAYWGVREFILVSFCLKDAWIGWEFKGAKRFGWLAWWKCETFHAHSTSQNKILGRKSQIRCQKIV